MIFYPAPDFASAGIIVPAFFIPPTFTPRFRQDNAKSVIDIAFIRG